MEIQPAEETTERIDLELVTRWLAANRDRAVTFDPTDLRTFRSGRTPLPRKIATE